MARRYLLIVCLQFLLFPLSVTRNKLQKIKIEKKPLAASYPSTRQLKRERVELLNLCLHGRVTYGDAEGLPSGVVNARVRKLTKRNFVLPRLARNSTA